MAAIVVPALIVAGGDGAGDAHPAAILAGSILIAAGVALWAWTVRLLARIGRGTLAPWDATQRLVIEGPYRHVRNPMISAVLAVLIGEALVFASPGLALYCAIFFAINWVYFVLSEEPGLERRFGAAYREYKRAVPRWLPRP